MDGVLFNSREPLRMAAVDTFAEIGVEVTVEDFVPFMGTGRLFEADTKNCLIRYLDFNKEESELQTLELKGVQPPAPKSRTLKRLRNQSSVDKETAEADGGSSSEGNLCLKISLPVKYPFSKAHYWKEDEF